MSWKTFLKAVMDLMLIGFFTFLASILTIISKLVESNSINIDDIYKDGCFFLYSISFFSSSLLFYLNRNEHHFGKYFLMILTTLCAIIYSQFINDKTSVTNFTKYGSITFISISVFFFLITQYQQRMQLPDINQEDIDNQNIIVQEVEF